MFLFFTESSSIFCKSLRLVCVLISAAGMSFPVWEFSKTHQPEKCVGLFAGKKAWRIPRLLRDTKGIHATHQKCKWLLSNLPMCFSKSAAGFWWTSLFFRDVPVQHAAGRDTSAALRGFAPCQKQTMNLWVPRWKWCARPHEMALMWWDDWSTCTWVLVVTLVDYSQRQRYMTYIWHIPIRSRCGQ